VEIVGLFAEPPGVGVEDARAGRLGVLGRRRQAAEIDVNESYLKESGDGFEQLPLLRVEHAANDHQRRELAGAGLERIVGRQPAPFARGERPRPERELGQDLAREDEALAGPVGVRQDLGRAVGSQTGKDQLELREDLGDPLERPLDDGEKRRRVAHDSGQLPLEDEARSGRGDLLDLDRPTAALHRRIGGLRRIGRRSVPLRVPFAHEDELDRSELQAVPLSERPLEAALSVDDRSIPARDRDQVEAAVAGRSNHAMASQQAPTDEREVVAVRRPDRDLVAIESTDLASARAAEPLDDDHFSCSGLSGCRTAGTNGSV